MILNFFMPPVLDDALGFDLDLRTRFGRRTDRDFSAATNDNRYDFLTRIRVGKSFEFNNGWTGYAQYQFTNDLRWGFPNNGSVTDSDLFQGYLQHKTEGSDFKVGRQQMKVGSERLIGFSDWSNRARSFDAVRWQKSKFDSFGGAVAGASMQSKFGLSTVIYKHDQIQSGSVDHYTVDHWTSGKVMGLAYDLDGALQAGRNGGRDQRAWAFHAQLGKDLSSKSKVSLRWDAASGGAATASSDHSFDNLYPSNHKFFGLMDMMTWRNMDQVAAEINHSCGEKMDFTARVCRNWLHDSHDAWYGSHGVNQWSGGTYVDPTGASGRDLGWEYNVESNWKKSHSESVLFGLGVFKPGSFVTAISGPTKQQVYGTISYSVKF